MRIILASLASAALLLIPAFAPPAPTFGHEEQAQRTVLDFPLELHGAGLGPAGRVELGDPNCVHVRAEAAAVILTGVAHLRAAESAPSVRPGRVLLQAEAPGAGTGELAGGLPLSMGLPRFELGSRNATFAVHLPEGAFAAAAGQRVVLTLDLEHAGAPLMFAAERCKL